MIKHTKGPWTVNEYETIMDTKGKTVGVCGVSLGSTQNAEIMANTRLVAAAPELLEALLLASRVTDPSPKMTMADVQRVGLDAIGKAIGIGLPDLTADGPVIDERNLSSGEQLVIETRPLEDAFEIIKNHKSVDFSESLKPCPCCIGHEQDLTESHDVGMGIDYVVCQLCGLRVDREGWNKIPRPLVGVKEEIKAALAVSNVLIKKAYHATDRGIAQVLEENSELIEKLGDVSE